MEDTKRRSNLGRGLSALFGEASEDYASLDRVRQSKQVPIEFLHPGRYQPRRSFGEEEMSALVESVRQRGILQPILVRRDGEDASSYEIIAGERRWRAAQMAGLHEVPVVIRDLSDREALEIALIENIQRQDLTALEEAEGYRRLMEEFSHTQEELAKAVGKSRSHVANTLRLLALPPPVKGMVEDGRLSAGHARALLTAAEPVRLAEEVVRRGLNVRQTEELAREAVESRKGKPAGRAGGRSGGAAAGAPPDKDPDTVALEQEMTSRLGLKVSIEPRGPGGTISVEYRTLEQLDEVLRRLSRGQRGDAV